MYSLTAMNCRIFFVRRCRNSHIVLLKSTITNTKSCSGIHICSRNNRIYSSLEHRSRKEVWNKSIFLRFSSSGAVGDKIGLSEGTFAPESRPNLDPIPDAPIPLPEADLTLGTAEASFESLGLGGWSPVGIIQNCFDIFHNSLNIPWWGSIVIGTIIVRTLMFPLVVLSQRNAARMHNNMPQMQRIQLKMSDARERGDRLEATIAAQELMQYMKSKDMNPMKNMIVPFAQAPLFISFFMGLREMASVPVESMKTGGLYWFLDLTVPDQYYILPLITSSTMAVTIELGTDAAKLNSANLGMMKYVFRAMPVIIFPFIINFSNAILVYWVSTNFISLIQLLILRVPRVRTLFKIDQLMVHNEDEMPMKNKGFKKGFTDSWTNMKLTRELEDREQVDQANFLRAGRGAIPKTYKYDPTKAPAAIQAKKNN